MAFVTCGNDCSACFKWRAGTCTQDSCQHAFFIWCFKLSIAVVGLRASPTRSRQRTLDGRCIYSWLSGQFVPNLATTRQSRALNYRPVLAKSKNWCFKNWLYLFLGMVTKRISQRVNTDNWNRLCVKAAAIRRISGQCWRAIQENYYGIGECRRWSSASCVLCSL